MEPESPYGLRYALAIHPLSNLKLRRTAKANARRFAEGQRAARIIIGELDQYTPDDSSLAADRSFYCVSYTILAFLADLNLSIVSLTRARGTSERHLLLRVMCLHIYEAFTLGKDFNAHAREIIQLRSGSRALRVRAGALGRELNRFADRNRSYVKPIRTHTIAHREEFTEFISAAESIDETRVLRLATEFVEIVGGLPEVLIACTKLSHAYFRDRWFDFAVSRATRIHCSPEVTE